MSEAVEDNGAVASDSSSHSDEFEGERPSPLTSDPPSATPEDNSSPFDSTSIFGTIKDNQQATSTSGQAAEDNTVPAPKRAHDDPPAPTDGKPSFHRLPDLPKELRLQVWYWIDPEPQILHLSYEQDTSMSRSRYNNAKKEMEWWGTWHNLSPQLLGRYFGITFKNLSICRESRNECLKSYPLIPLGDDPTNLIFFNFTKDILWLDCNFHPEWNFFEGVLPPPGSCSPFGRYSDEQVRHLAISKELWFDWKFRSDMGNATSLGDDWHDTSQQDFQNSVRDSMKNLQTLRFVMGGYLASREWNLGCYFANVCYPGSPVDPDIALIQKHWNNRLDWLENRVDITVEKKVEIKETVWAERLDLPGRTHGGDYASGVWRYPYGQSHSPSVVPGPGDIVTSF